MPASQIDNRPIVYLIPSLLAAEAADSISPEVIQAIPRCQIFFVENARSARRYLKLIRKETVIDDFDWQEMDKNDPFSPPVLNKFRRALKEGKTVGIISEAGCPGIADPGQVLVREAHGLKARVRPLTGPSSILLALMASGMNGQQFHFHGYLPIEQGRRAQAIRELEKSSARDRCTQIFIEAPYRNRAILEALLRTCQPKTLLSVAADLSSPDEFIRTQTVAEWRKEKPELHKRPTVFCLLAT